MGHGQLPTACQICGDYVSVIDRVFGQLLGNKSLCFFNTQLPLLPPSSHLSMKLIPYVQLTHTKKKTQQVFMCSTLYYSVFHSVP